jgi:hypothetical protein
MKKTSIGVALMLGLSGLYVQAQDMPRVAGYTLDATYVDQEPGIEALADVTFAEASFSSPQLAFYLHGELRVDEVKVDGKQVDVDHDLVFYPSDYSSVARRFRIELPGGKLPKKLSIRYSGKLNPSVARSPSNYMRVDREGVFLRSYPYSVWFPVFLEAKQDTPTVDVEATIRTPQEFVAVLTGERLGEEVVDGMCISCWRSLQDDIFNIQLTVRKFELMKQGGFHLYFLRDDASRATDGRFVMFPQEAEQLRLGQVTLVTRWFDELNSLSKR